MDAPKFKDFLVETSNPDALDKTLNQMGAALVHPPGQDYVREGEYYIMRAFGNPDFIKFACEHQGYCKVIGERDNPEATLTEVADTLESLEYVYARVAAKFAIRINEIFDSETSLKAAFESYFPQLTFDRTAHWKGILYKELDKVWREFGPDAKAGVTAHDSVEILFNLADYLDFNLYSQVVVNLQNWGLVSYRGRGDEQKQLDEISKKWEKYGTTPLSPAAKMVKNAFRPQDVEFNNDLSKVKALKTIRDTNLMLINCRVSPKGSTPAFADSQNFSMVGVGGDEYVVPSRGCTVWYVAWKSTPFILVNDLNSDGYKTVGIDYVFRPKSGPTILNEVLFSRGIATALWTSLEPGALVFPRMQSVMFVTTFEEEDVRDILEGLRKEYPVLEIYKDKRVTTVPSETLPTQS